MTVTPATFIDRVQGTHTPLSNLPVKIRQALIKHFNAALCELSASDRDEVWRQVALATGEQGAPVLNKTRNGRMPYIVDAGVYSFEIRISRKNDRIESQIIRRRVSRSLIKLLTRR